MSTLPGRCRRQYAARFISLLTVLAALFAGGSTAMAAATTVKEVAKAMVCPCPDCGKQALDQCPSCSVGQNLRDEIGKMLQQGKSKDEVLTQFAATYGDDILGDPPARGFAKYAAWMPFIAAACGLLPIACILILSGRRRKARRAAAATTAASTAAKNTPASATPPATNDPLLQQALRDFDY